MTPATGPWYPSISPSEHGNDSGRTHLFSYACPALTQDHFNIIANVSKTLPGGYNAVTRASGELFVLGGSFGAITDSYGPFVARLDATSLQEIWRTRLPGITPDDWNYPGAIGVHGNGDLYAIYGRHLARLDPTNGHVKAQAKLPVNHNEHDVAYNGFVLLSDGRIAAKSIHRSTGCTAPDFKAFLDCNTTGVPASTLVLVNPDTLMVEQTLIASEHIRFRLTDTIFQGMEYLYLPGEERIQRYRYRGGQLSLDESWAAAYRHPGQMPATAVAVFGDWVVVQTNGMPAPVPMSVIAISQSDAARRFHIEPFVDSALADSFMPSMPTVDTDNHRVYAFDGYAGALAALNFDPKTGFSIAWKVRQRSFAFSALVGPQNNRIFIATDLTGFIPDFLFGHLGLGTKIALMRHFRPSEEELVWRDAASGRELGRTARRVAAVAGSVLTPGENGSVYAPDLHEGVLVRLTPGTT